MLPEHLILACAAPGRVAMGVINAGSVFLGHYAPESAGDYATGTNHTLPTNGYAKAYSGVSVDSFVKKISFQQLSKEGLQGIAAIGYHHGATRKGCRLTRTAISRTNWKHYNNHRKQTIMFSACLPWYQG